MATLCYWSFVDRAWTPAILTSQLLTLGIFGPIKQVVTVTNRERFIKGGHGGQREVSIIDQSCLICSSVIIVTSAPSSLGKVVWQAVRTV